MAYALTRDDQPIGTRRLRRTSSADQVAAHIRRAIVSGELARGERINQSDIANDLGLSRIPVREAVIALDREGWVRFEPHRGAFVASLGADEIRDHYDLRGLVLGLIGRRLADGAPDDAVAALSSRLTSMRAAPDTSTFSDLNDRFFGRMLRTASSPRFTAALLVTPSILAEGFFDVVPGGREIQTDGLARVLRAVRKRDADAADHAMRTLLARHGAAVITAFIASGAVDPPVESTPPRSADVAPSDPVPQSAALSPADAVARRVRALIFDGRLAPGQRLPQDDIAEAIGVSRIPVREAIIALEREGWLRVEPHRGAFVLPLDDIAVADRFALYGRFYGFAAGRAISHLTPTDLEAFSAMATGIAEAETPKAMHVANNRYLTALVAAAASSRLHTVLRSADRIVPGNFFAAVPNSVPIQQRGMAVLNAAIEAGDPRAAEQATDTMERALALAVIELMAERRSVRA